MRLRVIVASIVTAPLLAGCQAENASPPPRAATVLVQSAVPVDYAPTLTLTGDIQARNASDLAFRLSGRVLQRYVEVGDKVEAGEKIAEIDSAQQRATQASAAATLAAAEAQLDLAASAHGRQQALFRQGVATRGTVDQALEAFRVAQANVDAASAQLRAADESLGQTTLLATAPGLITARYVEVGEVVQAAQPVFAFAPNGERDAVFDVYEAALLAIPATLKVEIQLASSGQTLPGTVRGVAPSLDAQTGTVEVRVTIHAPYEEVPLGSAVIGRAQVEARRVVVLAAGALSVSRGQPAVWLVDADTRMLALREVTIDGFEEGSVMVSDGLAAGDLVVVQGPRSMRAGQIVEISQEAAK